MKELHKEHCNPFLLGPWHDLQFDGLYCDPSMEDRLQATQQISREVCDLCEDSVKIASNLESAPTLVLVLCLSTMKADIS